MLLLDLLPKKDFKRAWVPATFALAGLVFGLAFFFYKSNEPIQALSEIPTVHLDDQQVIIATLDRLEKKYPEMHSSILEVEETLLRTPEVAQIEEVPSQRAAVRVEDRRLVFSRGFFQTDSISQETLLINLIVALHPELSGNSALARSKSFSGTGESPE